MNSIVRLALSVLLALTAWNAQAAVNGAAKLTNLTVTTQDLDTSDGVAPSFVIGDSQTNTYISVSAYFSDSSTAYDHWDSQQWLDAKSLSVAIPSANAQASTGPSFAVTSGAALADGGRFYANAIAPLSDNSFTLSAHTRLVIAADAELRLSMDARSNGNAGGLEEDNLYASVGVFASAPPWIPSTAINTFSQYITKHGPHDAVLYEHAQPVSVEVVNNSNMTVTGSFFVSAELYGASSVSPIPEPSTCALLLVGIGMSGVAYRSRKRT